MYLLCYVPAPGPRSDAIPSAASCNTRPPPTMACQPSPWHDHGQFVMAACCFSFSLSPPPLSPSLSFLVHARCCTCHRRPFCWTDSTYLPSGCTLTCCWRCWPTAAVRPHSASSLSGKSYTSCPLSRCFGIPQPIRTTRSLTLPLPLPLPLLLPLLLLLLLPLPLPRLL